MNLVCIKTFLRWFFKFLSVCSLFSFQICDRPHKTRQKSAVYSGSAGRCICHLEIFKGKYWYFSQTIHLANLTCNILFQAWKLWILTIYHEIKQMNFSWLCPGFIGADHNFFVKISLFRFNIMLNYALQSVWFQIGSDFNVISQSSHMHVGTSLCGIKYTCEF